MPSIYEKSTFPTNLPVRCARMNGTESYMYHWHKDTEIICGIRGVTNVSIESQFYQLHPGDVLFIAPELNHCVYTTGEEDERGVICFDAEYFFDIGQHGHKLSMSNLQQQLYDNQEQYSQPQFLNQNRNQKIADVDHDDCHNYGHVNTKTNININTDAHCHINPLCQVQKDSNQWQTSDRQQVYAMVMQIIAAYLKKDTAWMYEISALLYQLATFCVRTLPQAEPVDRYIIQKAQSLMSILDYISKYYAEPITLRSCSDTLGFNESYLSTMFRKSMGMTFSSYVQLLRLNQAAWLLTQTQLPVAEVAAKSGFASIKTFHRVFKYQYGMAPGEYRKHYFKLT